jgi:transposase
MGDLKMRWFWKKTTLTEKQKIELTRIASSRTQQRVHIERAKIVLACTEIKSNTEVGKDLNVHGNTVNKWRERWRSAKKKLALIDEAETGLNYTRKLLSILSDEPRVGAPLKFTAEQLCKIMSVACERPEDLGLPISHWSLNSLRNELIKRGIVDNISHSRLAHFLK